MATRAETRLTLGDDLYNVLPIAVTANAVNSAKRLYAVGQINAGREIIFRNGTNLGRIAWWNGGVRLRSFQNPSECNRE